MRAPADVFREMTECFRRRRFEDLRTLVASDVHFEAFGVVLDGVEQLIQGAAGVDAAGLSELEFVPHRFRETSADSVFVDGAFYSKNSSRFRATPTHLAPLDRQRFSAAIDRRDDRWVLSEFVSFTPPHQFADRLRALFHTEQADGFDPAHGTSTSDVIDVQDLVTSADKTNSNVYWPVLPRTMRKILSVLPIRFEDFVFVDFGCGKARGLMLAAERPFRKLLGVELAENVYEAALSNIEKMSPENQRRIEIMRTGAESYPIPDDPLVIYLFNPFFGKTLEDVVNNVRTSHMRNPRPIYVVYLDTCAEVERHLQFMDLLVRVEGDSPEFSSEFEWCIYRTKH